MEVLVQAVFKQLLAKYQVQTSRYVIKGVTVDFVAVAFKIDSDNLKGVVVESITPYF